MIKLTITIDDSNWTDLQRKQSLRILLADALHNFEVVRRGAYVDRAWGHILDAESLEEKREQVAARIEMAETIRTAVLANMAEEQIEEGK